MQTSKLKDRNKDFFEMVYQVVRLVPSGKVTSYGAIANYLGVKSGARMVGWAMNNSHVQTDPVPAHRVVNRQGLLTGRHHFNPPEKMQELLETEEVRIVNNAVADFKELFWDPLHELTS